MSRFAGAGQEFLDHRNFHHGDDLRAVNWRAYLRLEKLFLKMFQVEPRVPVRMLLDISDSMTAHGGAEVRLRAQAGGGALLCRPGAAGYASRSTASPTAWAQRIFSGGGRHRFHRRDGRHLPAMTAEGATDYLAVVREFIGTYSQRGLVIVISDFLDDNGCERALQYLADFGHELMLLQVWADEDRTPPWTGELELRDAETGAAPEAGFRRRRARALHPRLRRVLPHDSDHGAAQRRPLRGRLDLAAAGERDLRRADPRARDRMSG